MKLAFKLFFSSLVLIVLGQTSVVSCLRSQAFLISAPFHFGALQVRKFFGNQVVFWSSLKDLVVANRELRERILELELRLSEFKSLTEENAKLHRLLGLEMTEDFSFLSAKVVNWEGFSRNEFMVIDKGVNDGIVVGMAVLAENCLVGEVASVGPRSARVLPISNPSFRVFALDQDSKDRARGVVLGLAPGKLKMEKVFKEEAISSGDTIVTSGEGGEFPSGLVLGVVENVEQSDVLKEAILNLKVDLFCLEEVFVLK